MGWHTLAQRALGEPETIRTELVGAGGGPVEVTSDVRAELVRDDPERLYGFIVALQRTMGDGDGAAAAVPRGDHGDAAWQADGAAAPGHAED
jgi:hypothetical protein